MSIIEIINYFIKASISLVFLYTFYLLFLKGQHCFKFNRFYLLVTLLLSFVLPVMKLFTLSLSTAEGLDPSVIIMPELIIVDEALPSTTFPWFNTLLTIYGLGVLLLLVRFIVDIYKITVFIYTSKGNVTKKFGYYIINTNGELPTSTFFNYILWDDTHQLSKNEELQILQHEQSHVSQNHTWDIIFVELSVIVFWFNPVVWFLKSTVLENHEYLADANASHNIRAYTKLLAKQTLIQQGIPVAHTFRTAEVFKRLDMLEAKHKTTPVYKYTMVIIAMVFTFFTMSFTIENTESKYTHNIAEQPTATNSELAFDNEFFTVVDEPAEPKEGLISFYKYVEYNLVYPKSASLANIQGRVFIEFIVEKDGSISNTKILKGIHPECDATALKVVGNSQNWNPATHNAQLVRQKIVLPISFQLD